ncbi:alpha/beta fold hydrolase [Nocardia anaemiae]|uniref:alpha/beta fold hydrolase n=1 Tax=Nocardia anaemiae TaxID=263910 RepID=UPI001472151C|nr:alpha/beta hydrolase [Nocardia anaemiae]
MHGAFQTGATWDYVASELRGHGHSVHTPTLAGHGRGAALDLTHADGVASLVGYLRDHSLSHIVLVGHSIAGSFIAKAAEQIPERIKRVVFLSSIAVSNGNSLADEFPPETSAVFGIVDPAHGLLLPFDLIRERACNNMDLTDAEALYAAMTPVPVAFFTDKLDLTSFYEMIGSGKVKASYVNPVNDIALPPGEYGWEKWAERLGPLCRILHTPGAHYSMTTHPAELAETLIQAGRD